MEKLAELLIQEQIITPDEKGKLIRLIQKEEAL